MNRYQKNAAWVFRMVGALFFLYYVFQLLAFVFAKQIVRPEMGFILQQQFIMLTPQFVGSFLLILFAIPLGKLAAKGIEGD